MGSQTDKRGAMKVIPIEGNTQKLDGGALFGHIPKELWKEWMPPDEKNRISLACRALLLQTEEGKNWLFETGIGAFFDPKMKARFGVEEEHLLLKNLKEQGVEEKDIDGVILSHLHFDHAGGLLSAWGEGEPRLLFPKAKIYLSSSHWERAKNPHLREKGSFIPFLPSLLEKSGRIVFINGGKHPDFGEKVTFRFSNGHTIGLMISTLHVGVKNIVFTSDLVPGLSWVHLPVTMGYDRFPELVLDEKRELFENADLSKTCFYFTHDPTAPFAKVEKDSQGKYGGTKISSLYW